MPFEALEVSLKVVELLRGPIARLKAQDPDLARQLKRASSSTALNLAEGAGREGRDRRQHYRIARGSARETQAALRVASAAGELWPAETAAVLEVLDRLLRLLWGLTR